MIKNRNVYFWRDGMCLLAKQVYFKIQRKVCSTEQKEIEERRTIYMYPSKIITKHREFLMKDVLDISYRKIKKSGDMGLLYLHTTSGLYSYTIKTSPSLFIETFKKHKLR